MLRFVFDCGWHNSLELVKPCPELEGFMYSVFVASKLTGKRSYGSQGFNTGREVS